MRRFLLWLALSGLSVFASDSALAKGWPAASIPFAITASFQCGEFLAATGTIELAVGRLRSGALSGPKYEQMSWPGGLRKLKSRPFRGGRPLRLHQSPATDGRI